MYVKYFVVLYFFFNNFTYRVSQTHDLHRIEVVYDHITLKKIKIIKMHLCMKRALKIIFSKRQLFDFVN